MSKGVETRLVKPTETADLNIGELLQTDSWETSMGLIQTPGTWVSMRKPQKSTGPPIEVQYLSLA